MYRYDKKVLFSDIDANSKITIDSMMNAMQDSVNINSQAIGKGIDFMKETKRAWFAIGWCIYINKRPELFDELEIKTWPYDFGASLGYRNFTIEDKGGNVIVYADSIWSLMDMENGTPTKITEKDIEGYDLEPRYPMEKTNRKIKCAGTFEKVDEISVRKSDIDFNGHMSNAKYIQIAYEYVPFECEIKRIRVEYKKQSVYGEKINIQLCKTESDNETTYVVNFVGQDESVKAVVEFLVS